jgi:hypothetical protein
VLCCVLFIALFIFIEMSLLLYEFISINKYLKIKKRYNTIK